MSDLLKKLQKTEYEIFKEFDRICKKHNIKYFLGQGTLLGAVRHNGFIPWDDDMDVLIPYDELDRLISVFHKETSREYMITNHKIERNYPLPWTKIRAVNTLARPKRYKELPINWGICIDLFPMYPLSNNKLLRKLEVINVKISCKMLFAEMTKYEENHGLTVRLLEKIPIRFRHLWYNFATGILTKHKNTDYLWLPCRGGKIVRRDMLFGEEKKLLFEDDLYSVPSDYHSYLTANYGDYMSPPPEDEQKGHELNLGEIEWKL